MTNMFEQFLETPGQKKLTTVPRDTKITKQGNAIVVPENITYGAAAKALAERAKMEEMEMNRTMRFTCHPNDGYVALTRLIEDLFGFVIAKPTPGFFGDTPPQTKRIKTGLGVNDYVEAICDGNIQIPTLPDIVINVGGDEDEMLFAIRVIGKEKHKEAINAFLSELDRRIREESIYHGKAFDSKFNYLDLSTADASKVVLPQTTEKQVRANLFTPLQYRDRLKDIGTDFGRSVLLEGPYGTGKTLLAFCAGRYAVENGITFLYIRPEDHDKLPLFMRYARQYAPAVIFYEDIDLLMGSDDTDRTDSINLVLNTLDGIDAKAGAANDVMIVMTTNDVESINEALMRPGRIDAVIHIGLPDSYAAGKLIRQYGGESLALNFDTLVAGEACKGMTPAFIREIVERSKLVSLSRDPEADWLNIETDDVIVAAREIADHHRLASPRRKEHTTGDRLVGALSEVIHEATTNVVEPLHKWTDADGFKRNLGIFGAEPMSEGPKPLPVAESNGTSHSN